MPFIYSVRDPMEMRQRDGSIITARLAFKPRVNRHEPPQPSLVAKQVLHLTGKPTTMRNLWPTLQMSAMLHHGANKCYKI